MDFLPWFIWRWIIDCVVSIDPKYCLVCKDWFTYAAGRFMTINNEILCGGKEPSDWLKLAEKLSLQDFINLNKSFFKECRNIKTIELNTKIHKEKIPAYIIALLNKPPLKSIHIPLNSEELIDQTQYLLEIISEHVKSINLRFFQKDEKFNILSQISFSNLVKLEMKYCQGTLILYDILSSMEKLENLILGINNIDFSLSKTNKKEFNKLKSLEISRNNPVFTGQTSNSTYKLYDFSFPEMLTYKVDVFSGLIINGGIPYSMMNLKKLNLVLEHNISEHQIFPTNDFYHLAKLKLVFKKRGEFHVKFDFKKMPQLYKLQINDDFELKVLEKNHVSKLKELICDWSSRFPYDGIREQLSNLKTLDIYCTYLGHNLYKILKLCEYLSELTLRNLKNRLSSALLPNGPFKTTRLSLSGQNFLDNDLLNWLTSNFQLTHLKLQYTSDEELEFDFKRFSNLQKLNFIPYHD